MVVKVDKDRTLPESYRLIGLLPNLSKIAESIILSWLRDSVINMDPIPEELFITFLCRSLYLFLTMYIDYRWPSGMCKCDSEMTMRCIEKILPSCVVLAYVKSRI